MSFLSNKRFASICMVVACISFVVLDDNRGIFLILLACYNHLETIAERLKK